MRERPPSRGTAGAGKPKNFAGNQAGGGRQVARGRQWLREERNLGLNLAAAVRGAGPSAVSTPRTGEMNMQRGCNWAPRPPPPPQPPHYNFPNRILQSGPYSLAHKQFCFSALEPVNQRRERTSWPEARAAARTHARPPFSSAAQRLCARQALGCWGESSSNSASESPSWAGAGCGVGGCWLGDQGRVRGWGEGGGPSATR